MKNYMLALALYPHPISRRAENFVSMLASGDFFDFVKKDIDVNKIPGMGKKTYLEIQNFQNFFRLNNITELRLDRKIKHIKMLAKEVVDMIDALERIY